MTHTKPAKYICVRIYIIQKHLRGLRSRARFPQEAVFGLITNAMYMQFYMTCPSIYQPPYQIKNSMQLSRRSLSITILWRETNCCESQDFWEIVEVLVFQKEVAKRPKTAFASFTIYQITIDLNRFTNLHSKDRLKCLKN